MSFSLAFLGGVSWADDLLPIELFRAVPGVSISRSGNVILDPGFQENGGDSTYREFKNVDKSAGATYVVDVYPPAKKGRAEFVSIDYAKDYTVYSTAIHFSDDKVVSQTNCGQRCVTITPKLCEAWSDALKKKNIASYKDLFEKLTDCGGLFNSFEAAFKGDVAAEVRAEQRKNRSKMYFLQNVTESAPDFLMTENAKQPLGYLEMMASLCGHYQENGLFSGVKNQVQATGPSDSLPERRAPPTPE